MFVVRREVTVVNEGPLPKKMSSKNLLRNQLGLVRSYEMNSLSVNDDKRGSE